MKSKLNFFKKFLYMNIIGKSKNLFMNYSDIKGNIIKSFSSGFYFNGTLKRSFYAMESLLMKSNIGMEYTNKKYIINICSSFKDFKIKRNLKTFLLKKKNINIIIINYIRIRAHNGVRARKQRRK
jgi:ribosomal protein S11